MRKVLTGKTDWLRMEARLRAILRHFNGDLNDGTDALYMVSDVLGEETGRGFELTELTSETTTEYERLYPDIYPKQE